MIGLTLLAAACLQQPVAVLRSGTRVECPPETAVGARELSTPYGRLVHLRDPVVEIVDGARDRRLLEPLKNLDYGAWVARVGERGLLSVLMAEPLDGPDPAALLAELERWGRRIDPLPSDLERDARVETLWQRLLAAEGHEKALLCGRLQEEIVTGVQAAKRRVGLVDLRRALRGDNPLNAWAASRIAAHQRVHDLERPLFEHSVERDDALLRDVAADSLFALHPDHALGYWAAELWTADRATARVHAAEHLGEYGHVEPKVVEVLIYALAAEGHRAPGAYAFFGKQIAVVMDYDVEVALASFIADPQVSVLTEGTALQVRVISTTVSRTVRKSLRRLTGANPGDSRAAWLEWYQDHHEQARP